MATTGYLLSTLISIASTYMTGEDELLAELYKMMVADVKEELLHRFEKRGET